MRLMGLMALSCDSDVDEVPMGPMGSTLRSCSPSVSRSRSTGSQHMVLSSSDSDVDVETSHGPNPFLRLEPDTLNYIITLQGNLAVHHGECANVLTCVDRGLEALMNSHITDWIDEETVEELTAASTLLIEEMVATELRLVIEGEWRRARDDKVVHEEMVTRRELVHQWRAEGMVSEVLYRPPSPPWVLDRPGVLARLLGYRGTQLKLVEPASLDDAKLRLAGFPLLAAELGQPEESVRRRVPVMRYEPGAVMGGPVSQSVATRRLEARRFVVACMNLTGYADVHEET